MSEHAYSDAELIERTHAFIQSEIMRLNKSAEIQEKYVNSLKIVTNFDREQYWAILKEIAAKREIVQELRYIQQKLWGV